MRRPLLVALVSLALAVGVTAVAEAVGTDPPFVADPPSSTPQYQGFRGPFSVDFENAPYGTYEYSVENSDAEVVDGPHQVTWDGSGAAVKELNSTVGLAAGTYTFVVHDPGHTVVDSSLSFTVRGYAQPTCSVAVPKAVRVNAGQEVVTGRLAANCASGHITYASWEVDHVTRGMRNLMTFDHKTADTFSIFRADPLGLYVITPIQAINAAADNVRQNSPRMVVRLDSRFTLHTRRSGRLVTLSSTLTRYVRSAYAYRAWQAHPVTFSFRACGTCAWRRLAVRRTDRHGHAVLRVRTSAVRGYRVTAAGTTTTWAPYAKYSRR